MKLQLDTGAKTIKIEENVKLTKLMQVVKKILPNGEWQDFTLITNTVIERWHDPVYIKEYYPKRQWWDSPWYIGPTYYTSSTDGSLYNACGTDGSHNLNCELDTKLNISDGKNSIKTAELKPGIFNIEG